MLSTSQRRYLDLALLWAEKSEYRFRLGAVIVAGGRVRATGYSKYRNNPQNVSEIHVRECSIHAEEDAIYQIENETYFNPNASLRRATIYVARINKHGDPALAAPCMRCNKLLYRAGISKAIWTIDDKNCSISKTIVL